MKIASGPWAFILTALSLYGAATALAADTPRRGGTLTYLIPTDAPPSFDGHREWTFATAHTATPFYSVLIEANPENLSSTTDFVWARGCPSRPTTGRPTRSRFVRASSSTTPRR